MTEPIVLSHFMEVVRSRWNFEEHEFDAIENVMLDPECRVALLYAASGDLRERIKTIIEEKIEVDIDFESADFKVNAEPAADAILASLPGLNDEAIRANERERCAKVADDFAAYEQTVIDRAHQDDALSDTGRSDITHAAGSRQVAAEQIAYDIRSLKTESGS